MTNVSVDEGDRGSAILRSFGLPIKEGTQRLSLSDWALIRDFIDREAWISETPALPADLDDPLLAHKPPYGAFMMGFDFHLGPDGPRLIEINTNAGGLATVFAFSKLLSLQKTVKEFFVKAVFNEFKLARGKDAVLRSIAIVDDNVTAQGLYPEMKLFAELLSERGVQAFVCSPEDVRLAPSGALAVDNVEIDFVYNRMTDFRLTEDTHSHFRAALLTNKVVLSPHPAIYVRTADKRLLTNMKHEVIPATFLLSQKPLDEWFKAKKDFVFKPPSGNASKGVYRGDKLSAAKLKSLPGDTIVQQFVPPAVADDASKFDVRVYTHGADVLGLATRHFTGQVMEMRSEKSGFKEVLPDGVCCLPCLSVEHCAVLWETLNKEQQEGCCAPDASTETVHTCQVDGCSCSK